MLPSFLLLIGVVVYRRILALWLSFLLLLIRPVIIDRRILILWSLLLLFILLMIQSGICILLLLLARTAPTMGMVAPNEFVMR